MNVVAFQRIGEQGLNAGNGAIADVSVAVGNEWPTGRIKAAIHFRRTGLLDLEGVANLRNSRIRACREVSISPGGQLCRVEVLNVVDRHEGDLQVPAARSEITG